MLIRVWVEDLSGEKISLLEPFTITLAIEAMEKFLSEGWAKVWIEFENGA